MQQGIAMFIGMVVAFVIGEISGMNMGIMESMQHGPKQACLNLRVSVLNCNWTNPEP